VDFFFCWSKKKLALSEIIKRKNMKENGKLNRMMKGRSPKYVRFFCAVGGGVFHPYYLWLGWSSCKVINNDLIHPSPRVLEPVGGETGRLDLILQDDLNPNCPFSLRCPLSEYTDPCDPYNHGQLLLNSFWCNYIYGDFMVNTSTHIYETSFGVR